MSEWGNPSDGMVRDGVMNEIVTHEGTRGTETSQYPEEERTFRE